MLDEEREGKTRRRGLDSLNRRRAIVRGAKRGDVESGSRLQLVISAVVEVISTVLVGDAPTFELLRFTS